MNTNPAIGSPHRIEVLMWYHCRCVEHDRIGIPLVKETIMELIDLGALEASDENGSGYRTTPLGRAWVNAICATRLPAVAFVDEMGRIIES